ncbi:MAG: hypothetical protein R3F21_25855 [Myxococcota bacterium]
MARERSARPGWTTPNPMAYAKRERSPDPREESAGQRDSDEFEWMPYAALAGLVGAVIVALFFLVVDLAAGRAAGWTPAFLGSMLFRDELIPANALPLRMPSIVIGYTALHGVTFFAFALFVGASRLAPRPPQPLAGGAAAATALFIFVACQALFISLGWLAGPGIALAERMGFGWVSGANACAALGMTGVIAWGARRLVARAEVRLRNTNP